MKLWGGALKRRRDYLTLLILLLTLCFLLPGPTPVSASGKENVAIGAAVLGVIFTPMIAYAVWKNRPSQQGKAGERLLPGEFYVGGYLGASLVPNTDLKYEQGATLNNGLTIQSVTPFTLFNNTFSPGVVGGLKFGYFCKSIPYLGLEGEMNFAPNRVRAQNVTVSHPIQGSNQVRLSHDNWVNWTTALHIVGRYGFLPDNEVPFGRLQPYVGIGPGFVVMYDEVDAAKNFSIDVMAGIRYMMLKNVSAFVEYKFDHQFDAEMESHSFTTLNGFVGRGTAKVTYDMHRIVFGVAYHF